MRSLALLHRFWSKVDIQEGDKCWMWTAGQSRNGYGSIWWNGRSGYKSHRAAWELGNGPIPDGMIVRHRCDNPLCVNPSHLEIGTHLENSADCLERGRHRNGRDRWTHCPSGHEYTSENTVTLKGGGRRCRRCKSIADKRHRDKDRSAFNARAYENKRRREERNQKPG